MGDWWVLKSTGRLCPSKVIDMASMGSNLQGEPGELRMTIEIKRAATGKTETVELIGHADPEKLKQIIAAQAEKQEKTA